MDRNDWAALFDEASKAKGSHLALVMFTGIKVFLDREIVSPRR